MSKDAELESLRNQGHQIEDRIEGLQCDLGAVEEHICVRLSELVCAALGRERSEGLSFGYHKCPASPTEECCYDVELDPREDSCLFCSQPRERK